MGKGKSDNVGPTLVACGGIVCCIGLFLIVLLIPLGHSKVEYYETGLKMQRSTSQVDRSVTYGTGNHFIGPDYTFRKFQTSLNYFEQSMEVWTRSGDDDAGTSVEITVSFQYKLRKDNLGDLYSLVALNYEPLVKSKAIDSIKNTAPLFGVDSYLTQRTRVETSLRSNVSLAVSDVYADIYDFQLNFVNLEDDYRLSRLTAAVQIESNYKEEYVQEAALVRAKTAVDTLRIENNASRVLATAQAAATLIENKATYEATALVERARNTGLRDLFTQINITTEEHKASLDYILTLTDKDVSDDVKHFINFQNAGMQFPIG